MTTTIWPLHERPFYIISIGQDKRFEELKKARMRALSFSHSESSSHMLDDFGPSAERHTSPNVLIASALWLNSIEFSVFELLQMRVRIKQVSESWSYRWLPLVPKMRWGHLCIIVHANASWGTALQSNCRPRTTDCIECWIDQVTSRQFADLNCWDMACMAHKDVSFLLVF